ncbi:MAG: Zn-ribbon domain-containing OB-fold protein [Thermodesulfobacteriota bacterium]
MGFEKFGQKSFVAEARARDFASYLEQGRLMTTRCQSCGRITFPPKMDCLACGSSQADWIEIEEPGRLATWTIVRYGPAGFENETPYTLAVVAFPLGIKMFGQVDKRVPPSEIEPGMSLRAVSIKLANGQFSYHFEKA